METVTESQLPKVIACVSTYIIQVDDTGGDQYEELLREEIDRQVPHQFPPEIVSRPKLSLHIQRLIIVLEVSRPVHKLWEPFICQQDVHVEHIEKESLKDLDDTWYRQGYHCVDRQEAEVA